LGFLWFKTKTLSENERPKAEGLRSSRWRSNRHSLVKNWSTLTFSLLVFKRTPYNIRSRKTTVALPAPVAVRLLRPLALVLSQGLRQGGKGAKRKPKARSFFYSKCNTSISICSRSRSWGPAALCIEIRSCSESQCRGFFFGIPTLFDIRWNSSLSAAKPHLRPLAGA
jgi:hypothetical protein